MTELIVALDHATALEARGCFNLLVRETEARWFKIGSRTVLTSGAAELLDVIVARGRLFLDLKLYDTRDTVEAAARRAFVIGAAMLTVHATPSVLNAAMGAKVSPGQKVLAVPVLTDQKYSNPKFRSMSAALQMPCDGVICPSILLAALRAPNGGLRVFATDKVVVTPGIRLEGQERDNHVYPAAPREAKERGADFIVVGRSIYNAPDPAAAARSILAVMD